jgi:hypothetical protein
MDTKLKKIIDARAKRTTAASAEVRTNLTSYRKTRPVALVVIKKKKPPINA